MDIYKFYARRHQIRRAARKALLEQDREGFDDAELKRRMKKYTRRNLERAGFEE